MWAPSSTIVVGVGEPLFISSEDFQALEEAEKVDDGHSTVGGSARVH